MGARRSLGIREWRAADKHTGIGIIDGMPDTYEHIDRKLSPIAEFYRIECFLPYRKPTPVHREVHYVSGQKFDAVISDWHEWAAIVVDIRPLTRAEATAELEAFRRQHEART